MKQVGIIFGIVIVFVAVFIFVNKLYYPPLPIENLSAIEVIDSLEQSDSKVVEIAAEDDTIWYITRSGNQGVSLAEESIKQMVDLNGWDFAGKDGSGLFFEKSGERLVATTQMWSKKYGLVKVQSNFKKL